MQLRKLNHLLALADQGSFGRAAQAVHLSQPALSRSIESLEEDLGATLVNRAYGQVRLTAAGELVLARARHLLADAQQIKRDVQLLQGLAMGQLQVGLGPFAAAMLGQPALSQLIQRHPQLTVRIEVADAATLCEQLNNQQLDLFVAELLDWVRGLVSVAFVLLLPLLIIGTSLRGLVTDRDFMLRGFQDNRVATTTGLDQAQLRRVADAFVAYFQAPPGQIQLQVTAFGQSRPLFTEREVAHMEDVQWLIQLFLRMQLVGAAVVVIRLATAVAFDRSAVPLGRDMLWSTGVMVGLVVLVGFLSLLDFDALWTRFDQIAFRNDLWQLDPTRDYLIMLFPEPFWLAATVRMATSVGLQALLVLVLGLAFVLSPRFLGGRTT